MFDPAALAAFVAASAVLIAVPGPDMLFVIAQGAAYGRIAGAAAGLGVAAGNLWHTALVTAGAAAMVRTWPAAFAALKIAGVLYLLWLAWQAGGLALRPPAASTNGAPEARIAPRPLDGFRRGVAMNALNPKVALFFLAFLPQFADPGRGPVWVQTAILGAIFAGLVVLSYGPLGALAGLAGTRLQGGGGRAGRAGRWLLVVVYLALAVRLSAEGT